jgi:hypothetical protein
MIHGFHLEYLIIQFVPHRKHRVSITTINRLMLFGEMSPVCSENHTKPINILCGQNVECLKLQYMEHLVTNVL